MLKKKFLAIGIASAAVTLFFCVTNVIGAASAPGVALTGQVSSQEEGRMEGVLVSAKREDSTITVTVVSDAQGAVQLPQLEVGAGALRSRHTRGGIRTGKLATRGGHRTKNDPA